MNIVGIIESDKPSPTGVRGRVPISQYSINNMIFFLNNHSVYINFFDRIGSPIKKIIFDFLLGST
jgi:hypothetical protein